MSYWCDDRGLALQQARLDARQAAAIRPVVRRAGGWFATTGPNGWSGPWATERAAELAEKGDYDGAWVEQRKAVAR